MGVDLSINATHILTAIGTVVSVVIGGIGIAYRLGQRTTQNEASNHALEQAILSESREISELKGEIRKLSDVITELAVQRTQIDLLMKWYDELRRGRGYVVGPGETISPLG